MNARLRFICAGQERAVWAEWWDQLQGPKPPEGYSCDGCSWSPDWLRATGYMLWPACVIHDFHYREARVARILGASASWPTRAEADARLAANLNVLLRLQGGTVLARIMPRLFWGRVRVWGASAWQGEDAERWWPARVWEAWRGDRPRS